MTNARPKANLYARKAFHILAAVSIGFFALLVPRTLIHYVAVFGFIAVFIFEFIRLNTSAKKMVEDTVGPLLKRREFAEATGLFWLVVAALIVDLFAAPVSIAYGFFVLGLADSGASISGHLFPSRRLYRKKTLAGFLAFFLIAAFISLLFGLSLVPLQILLPWAVAAGFFLALVEMFSHPFDDNFTIMLIATSLLELTRYFFL